MYSLNRIIRKEKKMKNKLLATTALIALGASTSAIAEVTIGGDVEYVYQAITGKTAAASKELYGFEDNLAIKATKETDIGKLTYGFKIEQGATEGTYTSLESDNVIFFVGGGQSFQHLSTSVVPNTGDSYKTVTNGFDTIYETKTYTMDTVASEAFGYAIGAKVQGGLASIRYTQDDSNANDAFDQGARTGTPTLTVMYKGNLGVDGVNFIAGRSTRESGDGNTVDQTGTSLGVSYNFGTFSAGIGYKNIETLATNDAAQDEYTSMEYGVGYAVSDNLSLSLNHIVSDGDENGTDIANKEKITGLGIGYNLGGISLELTYADIENENGVSGADGEVLQIRTAQKF